MSFAYLLHRLSQRIIIQLQSRGPNRSALIQEYAPFFFCPSSIFLHSYRVSFASSKREWDRQGVKEKRRKETEAGESGLPSDYLLPYFRISARRLLDNRVIRMQMGWISGSMGDASRGEKRDWGEGRHPPTGRESRIFCDRIGDTGGGILLLKFFTTVRLLGHGTIYSRR